MLNYFIGKVCSIITVGINRNFKDEHPETFPQQLYNYFLGIVEAIDDKGIMIKQIQSDQKTYFSLSHIVCIAEEEVIKDEKEIKKIKKENLDISSDSPYVDPLALANLNKKLRSPLQTQ